MTAMLSKAARVPAPLTGPAARPWWGHPAYVGLLILGMAIPMLWPDVVPISDLPGHMGRYAVQLNAGHAPLLDRWYAIRWWPIGNLGVDLLMIPLGHLLGIEPAAKLVVMLIPPITAAGFLLVACETHRTLPPTAAFALPLAMGYPFQFGFVNFALSMGLAFLAFGLWLRMARLGRTRGRALLFVPVAMLVWLAHAFGWAVLGLLCFAAALAGRHEERRGPLRTLWLAMRDCLPLAVPLLLMLAWRSGGTGASTGFFDWHGKYGWLQSVLRDHGKALDGDSAELLVLLVGLGVAGLFRFDRTLLFATLLLTLAYGALPQTLLGSHYADMRLAPYLFATALLALGPRPAGPRLVSPVAAVAALLFWAVRIGATTASLHLHGLAYDRQLAAIDHIPIGARVYALVASPCEHGWDGPRFDHLPSMAIVRKGAFTNDQWAEPGGQLLTVRPFLPADFAVNPSQLVRLPGCARPEPLLGDRLARFPREKFDMVWLVGVPPAARPVDPGFRPVWQSADGALYRIVRS
jgi:hypothetical protein